MSLLAGGHASTGAAACAAPRLCARAALSGVTFFGLTLKPAGHRRPPVATRPTAMPTTKRSTPPPTAPPMMAPSGAAACAAGAGAGAGVGVSAAKGTPTTPR